MKAPALAHHHHLLSATRIPRTNLRPRTATPTSTIRMSLQENAPSLAVVGVTGAVGQEFLSVLSDRGFPYRSIKMLASKRSAGKHLTFEDNDYVIEELTADSFDGIDIALFSAGGSISKQFGPIAVDRGSIVVDNSSAFRMDENVPLVIPEVNPDAMKHIKLGSGKGALIANPNCSTIICLMAATPLHRCAKVRIGFLWWTHILLCIFWLTIELFNLLLYSLLIRISFLSVYSPQLSQIIVLGLNSITVSPVHSHLLKKGKIKIKNFDFYRFHSGNQKEDNLIGYAGNLFFIFWSCFIWFFFGEGQIRRKNGICNQPFVIEWICSHNLTLHILEGIRHWGFLSSILMAQCSISVF